jgi:predicted RNase H-like nuclease (RuvC/YqgF family)
VERDNYELRAQVTTSFKPDNSHLDFELQSKDNTIRRLNNEILELKSNIGEYSEKDITISSLRNEIFYLKKEVDDLNESVSKYTS